jgi:hypothetical protein
LKNIHLFKNYSLLELGTIDIAPILAEFYTLKEEDWEKYTDRQNNKVTAQKNTRYVPIIYEDHGVVNYKTEYYSNFISSINCVQTALDSKFKKTVTINRAIFTELPSGAVITPHMDSGIFLETHTRVHIPLISNENVIFKVHDGSIWNSFYLEPGKFYALNNCKRSHNVLNNSSFSRYHMIVDIKFPEDISLI